jgi:hypothetical protein
MRARSTPGVVAGLALLLLLIWPALSGCQFAQSSFASTASSAGSAFSAAATTLTFLHQGRLSRRYAASSFVNFKAELAGLDRQLPTLNGAPGKATLRHLLVLYRPAMQAVNAPCLDMACDWQAQIDALNRASKAFLGAGGS